MLASFLEIILDLRITVLIHRMFFLMDAFKNNYED